MIVDEVVGWHHRADEHEFKQALAYGEGQRRLVCSSPWCCEESDMTKRLNNSTL